MKRGYLCILLAVTIMLGMFCTAEQADPYGRYDEQISISFLATDKSAAKYDSTMDGRESPYDNAWLEAYEKYLNIKIDRTVAEDETALNALISTLLASGDLPDIMYIPKSQFYVLAANDALADLEDVYKENAGNLVQDAVSTFSNALDTAYYNGKMLGFPVIKNVHNSQPKVLWIRQDWLNIVGMEIPTTMEELYDVAKAFKEAQLGGENTYGLAINGIEEGLVSGFGAVLNTWQPDENGHYVYGNTTDNVKDGLEFMQRLYSDGLIRSDFAVLAATATTEDIANGLVGMAYGDTTWGVLSIQTCYNNDPNAEWVSARIPSLTGEPTAQFTNKVIDAFLVVNKNCKNPEALFKMLELELHMYYEPTDEERLMYNTCEDGYLMENLRVIRLFGRASYNVLVCDKIVEGVKHNAETIDPLAQSQYLNVKKGLAGDRTLKGRAYVYTDGYQLVKQLINEGNLVGGYNGPTTDNMTLYLETINTALNNTMLKIVMGDDVNTFDEAVELLSLIHI